MIRACIKVQFRLIKVNYFTWRSLLITTKGFSSKPTKAKGEIYNDTSIQISLALNELNYLLAKYLSLSYTILHKSDLFTLMLTVWNSQNSWNAMQASGWHCNERYKIAVIWILYWEIGVASQWAICRWAKCFEPLILPWHFWTAPITMPHS